MKYWSFDDYWWLLITRWVGSKCMIFGFLDIWILGFLNIWISAWYDDSWWLLIMTWVGWICIWRRGKRASVSIRHQGGPPGFPRIYSSSNPNTNTQIHKYTDTQIHKQTNTQIHKYTNTQIRQANINANLTLVSHSHKNTQTHKSLKMSPS